MSASSSGSISAGGRAAGAVDGLDDIGPAGGAAGRSASVLDGDHMERQPVLRMLLQVGMARLRNRSPSAISTLGLESFQRGLDLLAGPPRVHADDGGADGEVAQWPITHSG